MKYDLAKVPQKADPLYLMGGVGVAMIGLAVAGLWEIWLARNVDRLTPADVAAEIERWRTNAVPNPVPTEAGSSRGRLP